MSVTCVTHGTLMTDTHKRYTYTTEQYRQAHTLSIDMTHTCDISHTQCRFELSHVGVMTMLSVCVSFAVVSSEYATCVCLSWVCCVCTHCTLMTDTYKRYIYITEQYCHAHTLSVDMTHTCDTSHIIMADMCHQVNQVNCCSGCAVMTAQKTSHSLRALRSPYVFLVQLPYWIFVLFIGVHVTEIGGMLDAYCCSRFPQIFL